MKAALAGMVAVGFLACSTAPRPDPPVETTPGPFAALQDPRQATHGAIDYPAPHGPAAAMLADLHGVPWPMLDRIIAWESGWDPEHVNRNQDGTRDLGLMQLNSRYLREFARLYNEGEPIDPLDPATSLWVGVQHLAALYSATGDWRHAVAAYNCGLSRSMRRPLPASTERYLAYVFRDDL